MLHPAAVRRARRVQREAAPDGPREAYSLYVERDAKGANEADGPYRHHSAHVLLGCFTPRPSGGREGSSCEAAPDGPRETYSLYVEREAKGANEADGPFSPA